MKTRLKRTFDILMIEIGIKVDNDEGSSRIFKCLVAFCTLTHQRDTVESNKLDNVINLSIFLK